MKHYDENKGSSVLMYLDKNKLYGKAMPQKMFENGFKQVDICKFT